MPSNPSPTTLPNRISIVDEAKKERKQKTKKKKDTDTVNREIPYAKVVSTICPVASFPCPCPGPHKKNKSTRNKKTKKKANKTGSPQQNSPKSSLRFKTPNTSEIRFQINGHVKTETDPNEKKK